MTKIVTVEGMKFLIEDGAAYPISDSKATAATTATMVAAPTTKKVTIQEAIATGVMEHGRVDRDALCREVAAKLNTTAEKVRFSVYHVAKRGYIAIYPARTKGPQDLSWNGKPFEKQTAIFVPESQPTPTLVKPQSSRHVSTMRFKDFLAARVTTSEPQPMGPLLAEYNKDDGRNGKNQLNMSHFLRMESIGVVVDKVNKMVWKV
jgi:hypothetical protein